MRNLARFIVVLGFAAALLGIGGAARATTLHIAVSAHLTQVGEPAGIYGASADFEPVIEGAIERYTSIGLVLPSLRIYVHAAGAGCQGHEGIFGQFGQRDRIDLCTESRFIVLHELAHAWEQHTISDETRLAVLEHTGKAVWHDRDLPWLDSGAEVAANNIAWGLMGPPLTEPEIQRFERLLDRFTLLTGVTSPRIE